MQTIILPGGSLKNKVWLDACADALNVEGLVRPITWDHWLDETQKFNAKEKGRLIARHSKGDKLNIVAKSIGTLVASYVINSIPDQIGKVIFNGVPIHDISPEETEEVVRALKSLKPDQVLCIQNDNDPHASFAEARAVVPKDIELISKQRSDHEYFYFEDFNNFFVT
jgi:predicted alpha/beta-hydrolase family hydrolase